MTGLGGLNCAPDLIQSEQTRIEHKPSSLGTHAPAGENHNRQDPQSCNMGEPTRVQKGGQRNIEHGKPPGSVDSHV